MTEITKERLDWLSGRLVHYKPTQNIPVAYDDLLALIALARRAEAGADGVDGLYARAVALIVRDQKPSPSYLQRRLEIGYDAAARLIARMEADGLVGPRKASGVRDLLGFAALSAQEGR